MTGHGGGRGYDSGAAESGSEENTGTTWYRNSGRSHCFNILLQKQHCNVAKWQNVASLQNHTRVWNSPEGVYLQYGTCSNCCPCYCSHTWIRRLMLVRTHQNVAGVLVAHAAREYSNASRRDFKRPHRNVFSVVRSESNSANRYNIVYWFGRQSTVLMLTIEPIPNQRLLRHP